MNFHRNYYPTNDKQIIVNNYYNNTKFKVPGNAVNYIYKCRTQSGLDSELDSELDYNPSSELLSIRDLTRNVTVLKILEYLKEFSAGNFTNVRNVFSEFSTFSTHLYNLQMIDASYNEYNFVLNSIIISFESYIQSIYQYVNITTVEGKLQNAVNLVDILENMAKLEAYINEIRSRTKLGILPDVAVTAPLFELKPEYKTYIDLYGFPDSGVFDVTKLANIIIIQEAHIGALG